MTITEGASGSGPGTVTVAVTANSGAEARSGTLTIAGQAVTVRQDGVPQACTIVVSPASAAFSKDSATGTFTVTAPDSCAWSVASGADWVAVTSAFTGRGTAGVTYTVARNAGAAPRTGIIHVADAVFTVTQAGDAGTCDFHVSPVVINACMSASYDLVATLSTGNACGWTVTTDTPWIDLSGGSSRSGPGEIRFRIGDNYDAPRLGVVKVRWDTPTAGQNLQISQAGCRYAVSTTAMNVPADGGMFNFDVYQQSDPLECGGPLQNGCLWTASASAPWITITTAMPRAGDDRVTFKAASNDGAMRSATITVRDKSVTIVQAPR